MSVFAHAIGRRGALWTLTLLALSMPAAASDEQQLRDAIGRLASEDGRTRVRAELLLDRNAAAAAPLVVEALSSENQQVARAADRILAGHLRETRAAVERGLVHESTVIRLRCALILEEAATKRKQPVPAKVDAILVAALGTSEDGTDALQRLALRGVHFEKARPLMRELLESEEQDQRILASRAYLAYGVGAASEIPYLGELAWEGPDDSAGAALFILGRFGPKALPHVARVFESDRDAIRSDAIESLGRIGAPARAFVPRLLVLHAEAEGRYDPSLLAAMRIAPEDPRVLDVVRKELAGPRARDVAHLLLFKVDPTPFADVLRDALGHKELRTRLAVAQALRRAGKETPRVVETLLGIAEAAGKEDQYPRREAIEELGWVGPAAAVGIPRLLVLAAEDDETFELVVERIPLMGAAALPHLRAALQKDGAARAAALQILAVYGPLAVELRDVLAELGADPKHERAVVAILKGLDEFPMKTSPAILLDGLRHKRIDVRIAAADELAQRSGSYYRDREPLRAMLLQVARSDPSELVRLSAVRGFWFSTGATDEIQSAVLQLLDSKEAETRATAFTLIHVATRHTKIPEPMRAKLFALALGDPIEDVRVRAIATLFESGFPAGAGERILVALEADDAPTRAAAALMAGRFPELADRTVPLIAKVLDAKEPRLRLYAIESLYTLGPVAQQALPKLKETRAAATDAEFKGLLDQVIERVSAPKEEPR
ncbi:MAG: hypothetical protein AAGD14_14075 [Planctomycetota bacterium]